MLQRAKKTAPDTFTKSSIMVGLGESEDEVVETMRDLRAHDVDFLTVGQYLRPTKKHLALEEFVTPEQFKRYEEIGLELGFGYVASGPLVRSSYKAGEYFIHDLLERKDRSGRLKVVS